MQSIIFAELKLRATEHKLDITVETDYDKYVKIVKREVPINIEALGGISHIQMLIWHVETLINLDTFGKIHFKKTFSTDSTVNQHLLRPSQFHLRMFEVVERGKITGYDLFNKAVFDTFVCQCIKILVTHPGKGININFFESLDDFGQLIHGKSYMNDPMPDLERKITFDKKVPVDEKLETPVNLQTLETVKQDDDMPDLEDVPETSVPNIEPIQSNIPETSVPNIESVQSTNEDDDDFEVVKAGESKKQTAVISTEALQTTIDDIKQERFGPRIEELD